MADERDDRRSKELDFRSPNDFRAALNELDVEVQLLEPDDYDAAIVGVAELPWCEDEAAVVYDLDKVRRVTRRLLGGSWEEADEWVSYNIVGAYVGKGTPIFLRSRRSLLDEA